MIQNDKEENTDDPSARRPLPMGTFSGRSWEASFDQPHLTSDAGIAALAASGIGGGLISALNAAICDPRRGAHHSIMELLRQRIFQIAGGYNDGNDSDHLRNDVVMRSAAGKPADEPLASQPTISRLENGASKKDLLRMARAIFEDYLASFGGSPPRLICIDMDPSAHLVYGQQQLGLFNTHVGDTCLMPFYIFDGTSGKLMAAALRPGKTPMAGEIITILKRLIRGIRKKFPDTTILFRADSHHTKPAVMDFLEGQEVEHITGLGKNKVLERLFADEIAAAQARYESRRKHDPQPAEITMYASGHYAAGSWSRERRVIARIIVGPLGTDVRYIVSSYEVATAQYLYQTVYCGRGEAELYIKECKLGLGSDTSPCTRATANQFRLLLHAAAYVIMHRFREQVLKGTRWEKSTIAEIRLRVLKVAARIEVLKTKVRVRMSEALWEAQRSIWERCARRAPA